MIQITSSNAIDIIVSYAEHNKHFDSKIEKLLLEKGIIWYNFNTINDFVKFLERTTDEILLMILEQI